MFSTRTRNLIDFNDEANQCRFVVHATTVLFSFSDFIQFWFGRIILWKHTHTTSISVIWLYLIGKGWWLCTAIDGCNLLDNSQCWPQVVWATCSSDVYSCPKIHLFPSANGRRSFAAGRSRTFGPFFGSKARQCWKITRENF